MKALPTYDDKYIKTKIKTYGDKVHTGFRGLSLPEDDLECESFTDISIDFLLVYESTYYLQVYLDNCAYKIIDKRMIDYLGDNPFETDEDYFLIRRSYKYCLTIELIYAKELMLLKVITLKNV